MVLAATKLNVPDSESFISPVLGSTTPDGIIPLAMAVAFRLRSGYPVQVRLRYASGLETFGFTHCEVRLKE